MSTDTDFKAEAINEHIVNWLRTYADNAKVKGFVVGISGGIDSALTSSLCAQTGLPTLCVEMPIHQAESHVSRAKEHVKLLKERFSNVSSTEANLTKVFDDFKNIDPETKASLWQSQIEIFDDLIKKSPNNYYLYLERGGVKYQLGLYSEA